MNKPKEHVVVTVSNKTVLRVIVLIVVSLLAFRFLGRITHVLTLIFVAFFLSLALNPAVSYIAKRLKSRSRVRATGVAYLVVLTVLIAFFSIVIPPLVRQTVDFVNDVPQTLTDFQHQDSAVARFARRYKIDEQIQSFSKDFSNRVLRGDNASRFGNAALSAVTRVGGTLISIITVLVLTFMMLVEGPYWLDKILSLQSPKRRKHLGDLSYKMYRVVTGYVNGQLLISLIAAGFALMALLIASTIFNVTVNAVALAGIVLLLGLIPMIGNTLAAAIVILVCLLSSVGLAITMGIYFLVYQQVENATLQPYIQAKHNELTPLLVFCAALIGVGVGGLLGGLLAIPVAGCGKILLEDYLERRGLNVEDEPSKVTY